MKEFLYLVDLELPKFAIKKDIGGHGIDDVTRKAQLFTKSGKEFAFQRIPQSAHPIIFLKQPPKIGTLFNFLFFTYFSLKVGIPSCRIDI